jgi:hypothetical protein
MNQHKAQAAMEFIMTYGWALLVIMVAVGALAYFGILSPQDVLPERCNFQQEFPCTQFQLTAQELKFELQNAAAQVSDITSLEVKETTDSNYYNCSTYDEDPSGKILIEQRQTITCGLANLPNTPYSPGQRVKLKVRMVWNNNNLNFNHTGFGEVYAIVQ